MKLFTKTVTYEANRRSIHSGVRVASPENDFIGSRLAELIGGVGIGHADGPHSSPFAETIPAKLSSTTKQSDGTRCSDALFLSAVYTLAVAGMSLQCSQGEPVAFGVRLALCGVFG